MVKRTSIIERGAFPNCSTGVIKMEDNDDSRVLALRLRIPKEAWPLFGRAPVINSESKVGYWSLVESIEKAVGPRDVLEWLIVRNMVDLTWNIFFYRRVGAGIIDVARMEALISILGSILPNPSAQDARKLAKEWFNRKLEARSRITGLFIEHHINDDHINSEAVRLRSQTIEQIERMLASMESRYRQYYKDIYVHRESLRMGAEIEKNSTLKQLPVIPAGELSHTKQVPEQDEPSDDKEGPQRDLAIGEPETK
jgi:hypothetical protein